MSCVHLKDFKSSDGLKSYEVIHSTIVSPNRKSFSTSLALISCFDCEKFSTSSRLHACLHCIYFGCREIHIDNHCTSKNHQLCVELSNGHIYCFGCKDVVFDPDVDEIVERCLNESTSPRYVPWKPSPYECELLKEHPKRIKIEAQSSIGMRGIFNNGSTCYMSSVMQALLHTPLLRDYFFTDRHICYAKERQNCLICHFFSVFQRYYSDDDPATLSLHEILYFVVMSDDNFSTFGQKDAHEFFISARNFLQTFSSPPNEGSSYSIINAIFHGTIQSDVVCLDCSYVSTTVDPSLGISLDIYESEGSSSLSECLDHFTMAEPLGNNCKFSCAECKTMKLCTKQSTFRLLPLILVIHMKRFLEIRIEDDWSSMKNTLFVSFPIELDMYPYTTGQRNKTVSSSKPGLNDKPINCDYRYSLYAVIVHHGEKDNGHYTAFIQRPTSKWFRCNDMSVEPVSAKEVLLSEAYLLFYHKTVLPYA